MDWKRLLAYITGSVDQELLLRNEYLVTENRILKAQIRGRIRLKDEDRISLAEIGKRLGAKALAAVATIVTPDTILRWHRELVARKFDGSKQRKSQGRPPISKEIEDLIVRFAKENRTWGYDKIVVALKNLGHTVSDETVGNVLDRHGIPPAPKRQRETTWADFIRSHMEVLHATDFLTTEVWTWCGLMTYYIVFFIHLSTRKVHIAGITLNPDEVFMKQVARNVTFVDEGFLTTNACRYLIHDRDSKYSLAFDGIIKAVGIDPVRLPPHSPNLNCYAERFVKTLKNECLDKMIFFGEASLRHALDQFMAHYHEERNHQGRDNELLFPVIPPSETPVPQTEVACKERLGGLLRFYHRKAA